MEVELGLQLQIRLWILNINIAVAGTVADFIYSICTVAVADDIFHTYHINTKCVVSATQTLSPCHLCSLYLSKIKVQENDTLLSLLYLFCSIHSHHLEYFHSHFQ